MRKIEILNFFLCELPLILGVARKRKEQAEDIWKGTPDIEFEQDWSVGLGATLAYVRDRKLKTIFLVSRIFPRKADSVMLLGLGCAINPQNLKKIVIAIFLENRNFFFLCELPLILGVARKRKNQAEDICNGTPDIEFEQDWSVC